MYHSGMRVQRGRGLGSILGGLWRGLAPVARLGLKAGKNLLQSPIARKIGTAAIDIAKDSARNLAADLIEGNDVNQRAQEELQNARSKIASTLRGGRKRKKHLNSNVQNKKKKYTNKKYNILD